MAKKIRSIKNISVKNISVKKHVAKKYVCKKLRYPKNMSGKKIYNPKNMRRKKFTQNTEPFSKYGRGMSAVKSTIFCKNGYNRF